MSVVFVTVLSAFLLLPQHGAKAADSGGEYIYFRIDTELDVLNAKGVTVEWSCNGAASGSITDTLAGYASESSPGIDGIVKVASISKEFTDSTCIFGSSTISAKATINGWVTRKWTAALLASTSVPFTTGASMDYEIVVGPVKNELSQPLTFDGAATNSHASASYSGTTASSSYSGGYLYIAGTTSGGTVKAESSGFVSRTSTALTISQTASQSVAFDGLSTHSVNASGLDYAIVVKGVADELGTALTLDGSTASASYSGTVASQSYYDGKRYIAGSTSGGTVTAEHSTNAYVKRTSSAFSGANAISEAASKSVDFGTTDDSDLDESGLLFAVKVNLDKKDRTGKTYSDVTGATVTAGNSLGVPCTDHGNGDYYCAVPLAHTGVVASAASIPVGGESENVTCTYTDRTVEADTQSTCTITANEPASGGGNSGGGGSYIAVVTPTPTPVPGLSPTPTPTPVSATLYRKANDPKVYVQGSNGTLTWVKTIEEFNTAGYKWSNVQVISGEAFAKLNVPSSGTVSLFRKANDPKVYVQGSDGTLTWVKTIEAFNAAGYKWTDVKTISGTEFAQMRVGGNVRVVSGIAFLRVRAGPSTANNIVGQVSPNQELKFTEMKNGWYHINSGWVSGAYAKEF